MIPGGESELRYPGGKACRLPQPVIERAAEVLSNLESSELDNSGEPRLAAGGRDHASPAQLSLLSGRDPLREELRSIEINTMTPLEALTRLQHLKESLDN